MANETIDFVQQIAELSIATDPTLFASGATNDKITALPFNTRGTDPAYAPILSLSCVYLENDGNGQAVRWGQAVQEMTYWWTYDSNNIEYASSWDFFLKSEDCKIGGTGFFSIDEPTQEWIDKNITLKWQDYNGNPIEKSGTIRYSIYQDGDFYGSDSYTQELESSTWGFTISGLPKYDDDIFELSSDSVENSATETQHSYTIQFPDLEATYIIEEETGEEDTYILRSYDADYTITVNQKMTLTTDGEEFGFRWTSKLDKYHVSIKRSTDGGDFEDYESFILDPFLHGVSDPSITLSLIREETVEGVTHKYSFQTTCYNDLADVDFAESGDEPTQSGATFTATINGVCETASLSKPSTIELNISDGSYTPVDLGIGGINFDNETEYSSVLAYVEGEGWINASKVSLPDEATSSITLDVRILRYPFYKSITEIYGIGDFEGFTITPEIGGDKCSIDPNTPPVEVEKFDNISDSYSFNIIVSNA